MSTPQLITLTLDRRLIEHPSAHHIRRMRIGLWLYLALLARLPAGSEAVEVDPAIIAREMGLPEGTVRSWLGHLRKAGYVGVEKLNGTLRVSIPGDRIPTPAVQKLTRESRAFTVAKLENALGEPGQREALEAALGLYPDGVIRKALAGTLAVPAERIRRSRTALFIYLLKRHAKES